MVEPNHGELGPDCQGWCLSVSALCVLPLFGQQVALVILLPPMSCSPTP